MSRRRPPLHVETAAAVVSNVAIVVTGGIVRLTGSGLGCPQWPTCDGDRVVPGPGSGAGWHQAIEFGNRVLAVIVLVIAVRVWWVVRRERPDRAWLATLLLAGVVGQGLLGGVTVLTGLQPLVVAAHLLASMALVAVALVLHRSLGATPWWSRGLAPAAPTARPDRWAVPMLVALGFTVLVLGTLVTATGPHAGDPGTPRLGLDLRAVSRAHAAAVWAVVALTGIVVVRARGRQPWVHRTASVLLITEALQAVVGYTQYALRVPPTLVAVHLVLACLFWIGVVEVALAWASARRDPTGGRADRSHGRRALVSDPSAGRPAERTA